MARKDPEKDKEYRKHYHQTPQYKKWRKEWYSKWILKKGVKEKLSANSKKYIQSHRAKVNERHKIYIRKYIKILREQVITKFGAQCKCCGEKDFRFLSIDHINGDGKQHRLSVSGSTRTIYQQLLKEGSGKYQIQILCFNCNMGRQFSGGKNKVCPHKLSNQREY